MWLLRSRCLLISIFLMYVQTQQGHILPHFPVLQAYTFKIITHKQNPLSIFAWEIFLYKWLKSISLYPKWKPFEALFPKAEMISREIRFILSYEIEMFDSFLDYNSIQNPNANFVRSLKKIKWVNPNLNPNPWLGLYFDSLLVKRVP